MDFNGSKGCVDPRDARDGWRMLAGEAEALSWPIDGEMSMPWARESKLSIKLDFVADTRWILMVPAVAMMAGASRTHTTWRAAVGLMGTAGVRRRKIAMVIVHWDWCCWSSRSGFSDEGVNLASVRGVRFPGEQLNRA